MFKNKKGYTIIEIITVLMIMGVILLLIVPVISNYIEKGRTSYYEALENQLDLLAKDYYSSNIKELPRGQINEDGQEVYITKLDLSTLEEKNYVTNDVVDKNGEECEESYIRVENEDGKYTYEVCLICEDYITESQYCNIEYKDDSIKPTCDINGETESWTNKDVTLNITGTDSDSGIVKFLIDNKIIKAVNSSATFVATENKAYTAEVLDRAGNTNTCLTEELKIDKVDPYCESVSVLDGQTSHTKIISVSGKDALSGIENITIGTSIYQGNGVKEIVKEREVTVSGAYAITIKDVAGTTHSCGDAIVTGLDSTSPEVVWSGPYTTPTGTTPASYSNNGDKIYYKLITKDENGVTSVLNVGDINRSSAEKYSGINIYSQTPYSSEGETGYEYIIEITVGSGDGSALLTIPANKIKDPSDNGNIAQSSDSSMVDNTAPTGTLTSTGTWETSQTITLNSSSTDLASSPYSFTSPSSGYSTTKTRSGLGAGNYTGYIIDKAGNVKTLNYTVNSQTQYSYRTRGTSSPGNYTYHYCGSGYGSSSYGITYFQDYSDRVTYYTKVCTGVSGDQCNRITIENTSSSCAYVTSTVLCGGCSGENCWSAYERANYTVSSSSFYTYRCYRYEAWSGWTGWSTSGASTNYNDAGYVHTVEAQSRVVYN